MTGLGLVVGVAGLGVDPGYVTSTIRVSLQVSVTAVVVSSLVCVPVAVAIGFRQFRWKGLVTAAITTGMGFPSVVVGLLVLLMVSKGGPLGPLDLTFTPAAMIIAQVVLAAPVILGVSLAAVTAVDDTVRDAAFATGGTRVDVGLVTVKEARYGIATAVLAGFGRAISEVGAVLIVGGNIVHADGTSFTRTLTTAIQLEARQGRFDTAIILGVVLVALVLVVNSIVLRVGSGERMR